MKTHDVFDSKTDSWPFLILVAKSRLESTREAIVVSPLQENVEPAHQAD
jgi:hypothetical protein